MGLKALGSKPTRKLLHTFYCYNSKEGGTNKLTLQPQFILVFSLLKGGIHWTALCLGGPPSAVNKDNV